MYYFIHIKIQLIASRHIPSLFIPLIECNLRFILFNLLLLSLQFPLPRILIRLVVEDNQIPSQQIKTGQVLTRVFGIENIIVNDEGCAAGIFAITTTKINKTDNCLVFYTLI